MDNLVSAFHTHPCASEHNQHELLCTTAPDLELCVCFGLCILLGQLAREARPELVMAHLQSEHKDKASAN